MVVEYPLNALVSSKAGATSVTRFCGGLLSGCGGIVIGGCAGFLWPVAVPLYGLYLAEDHLGIKLC